jgi:3-dehydroquinate synthetase
MSLKSISVHSAAGSYDIVCGGGVLNKAASRIAKLGKFSSVHIVSSPRVWRAAGKVILRNLAGGQFRESAPDERRGDAEKSPYHGECFALAASSRRRSRFADCRDPAARGGRCCRFVAASYLRGVRFVQVPTTVVAQVDSSIGGKTGVNLPEGKNLVGAFYPPKLILTDPRVLRTLPARIRGGLAEVIKHSVIADAEMFAYLEKEHRQSVAPR